MGTYLIIGSGEGQLDCGKVEESHSEINPGVRHDSNGKWGVNMAAATVTVENNSLALSSIKGAKADAEKCY